jgi:hypothetical protein
MIRWPHIADRILDAAKRGERRSVAEWARRFRCSYIVVQRAMIRRKLGDVIVPAYTATEALCGVLRGNHGKKPRLHIGSMLLRGAGLEAEQLLQARVVNGTIVISRVRKEATHV